MCVIVIIGVGVLIGTDRYFFDNKDHLNDKLFELGFFCHLYEQRVIVKCSKRQDILTTITKVKL